MLVLTRKIGEAFVLPQCGITVTVVGVAGNRVRLGIDAPADIAVHRCDAHHKQSFSAAAEAREGVSAEAVSAEATSEQARRLAEVIQARLGGRAEEVFVEAIDERLVVHARVRSYYVRQLIQATVLQHLQCAADLSRLLKVDFKIAVEPRQNAAERRELSVAEGK